MGWFFALETPTQVAIVGIISALVVAAGGIAVAYVNRAKPKAHHAEIAALTLDASAVKQVAAAIEGLNLTLIEQNKVAVEGGAEMVSILRATSKELEELRREVRTLGEKVSAAAMRG